MAAPDDDPGDLLVVVLDVNPVWWGEKLVRRDVDLTFSQFLDGLMVFCNSHLMLSHKNKLAVIAAHTNSSKFIYPVQSAQDEADGDSDDEAVSRGDRDGKYELFAQLNETLRNEIKELMLNDPGREMYADSLIAGAMSMALCYIHRLEKDCTYGESLSSRILVIKGSEDNPSQYMNFMNVVFTAQKQNVVIDGCVLDHQSGLLQQGSDITGGIYLKLPQLGGFLQYLLWVFLPGGEGRSKLNLPPQVKVDYRAACFCHRTLIEVGYVCSVCLSIFCAFSPICSTCQTTFKFLGLPKTTKKKSKKSGSIH